MNCILIEPAELLDDRRVRLDGERATHIRTVLRKGVGDTIKVGLLDGPLGSAKIIEVDEQTVTVDCTWGETPPRPNTHLVLAVPRPKVLRRLWAQLAALGVAHIHLVNAEKVERFYFDSHVITPETYRPLLVEGLQQAVDTHLPEVSVHRAFRPFVEDRIPALTEEHGIERCLMLHPRAKKALAPANAPCLLALGPEGGWNKFERDLLASRGFVPRILGTRVLRSDTACIAALSILGNQP